MKSPGHKEMPDHKVDESHIHQHMRVKINGETESDDVIEVDEDGAPPRYYFNRSDVKMDRLSPTRTETKCPFKGTAHYFNINSDGDTLKDAVWTYEDPYEEHAALKNRVAFYDDRVPEIAIEHS